MIYERQDIWFESGGSRCAAWAYIPSGSDPHPGVVMAHGLGGQRGFRLDAYAERFAAAGLACLVFDYRHFGDSEGQPRQLVSIRRQLADWRAALSHARQHEAFDPKRLAVWGTSLAGGHVQTLAASDRGIAAAIAQIPFADGVAVSRAIGLRQGLRLLVAGNRDLFLRAPFRREPYRVRFFGPPGSLAGITAPGAEEAIRSKLMAPGEWDETTPARIFSLLAYYRPNRRARRIECPIMFQIGEFDRVTPPKAALKAAARARRSELKRYPIDHFDIYAGEPFEQAVADQIEFLGRHLGLHPNQGDGRRPSREKLGAA